MVSVIVPVYNVELYLDRCIQSICGQTYRDLEITLVDDGSTDRSGEICDIYAKQDDRIKVIHKQNGGLVSARKAGLDAASGEFTIGVDSDDWIEPDFLSQMAAVQRETGADIVTSGVYIDIGENSHKLYDNITPGVYSPEDLLPGLVYSGVFFEYGIQPHIVTKLFRKEIMDKVYRIIDLRLNLGEDAATVYPCVLEANKIAVTHICGYHYAQNPGSMSRTEKDGDTENLQRLFDHLETVFIKKGKEKVLLPQLEQCKKFYYSIRCMQVFKPGILMPYGGVPKGSRVVIYGAGLLGQQIYHYLKKYQRHDIIIVLWVDRNAAHYQEIGMDVHPLEQISRLDGQYDCVLIASTTETVAAEMRRCLQMLQVPSEKIRWFSEDFINF